MTGIYLSEHSRLKSYGATTKGEKTVVRIEIETADHLDAGFLLKDLKEITQRQKEAEKRKAEPKKTAKLLALPAPALQLTYRKDTE